MKTIEVTEFGNSKFKRILNIEHIISLKVYERYDVKVNSRVVGYTKNWYGRQISVMADTYDRLNYQTLCEITYTHGCLIVDHRIDEILSMINEA